MNDTILELLSRKDPSTGDFYPEDEIIIKISQYLSELLQRNPEKLNQILYRLDVGEREVMEALGQSKLEEKALSLSRSIVKRQVEKMKNWGAK
jgi:hypothetical protein